MVLMIIFIFLLLRCFIITPSTMVPSSSSARLFKQGSPKGPLPVLNVTRKIGPPFVLISFCSRFAQWIWCPALFFSSADFSPLLFYPPIANGPPGGVDFTRLSFFFPPRLSYSPSTRLSFESRARTRVFPYQYSRVPSLSHGCPPTSEPLVLPASIPFCLVFFFFLFSTREVLTIFFACRAE